MNRILTINGGSSSIKFAAFEAGERLERVLAGQVQRIGQPDAGLSARDGKGQQVEVGPLDASTYDRAAVNLAQWLKRRLSDVEFAAIGHRIVHGGVKLLDHQIITSSVIDELKRSVQLDLPHLPGEIALIEAFTDGFEHVPQFACFDTAFHRDLPTVARLLPIPREFERAGVRRFGFHGLSYAYLMEELKRIAGEQTANGRVILAHLGAGASMAAVRGGRPIDTTMSFTPIAGLVMTTRPGDLDPGLLVHLIRSRNFTADQLDDFISRKCGLIGLSETSSDMRDLAARRATDSRAAEAIDVFCYQAKKWIGAYAAALGGLDTLVFAGGIGEHSPEVRGQICDGLEFLGMQIDRAANSESRSQISTKDGRVAIRVIPTDEELMIARILLAMVPSPLYSGERAG